MKPNKTKQARQIKQELEEIWDLVLCE